MAIPTQTYVDPAIAGNSGAGTTGDPYGDLQHALDTITKDATNGDQINIKAGTDEILAAAIDLTSYGTPADARKPLIFRGYTSAANDGGIGGISGNGGCSVFASATLDHIHFVDVHCHNCGANVIVRFDRYCSIQQCEINNASANAIQTGSYCKVSRCHVHDVSGVGVSLSGTSSCVFNYLENGDKDFSSAISGTYHNIIFRNIIHVDGTSFGMNFAAYASAIIHNSILSDGGTGTGVLLNASHTQLCQVLNNVVEGFSGAGGKGFAFGSSAYPLGSYGGNHAFNNTTNYNGLGDIILNAGDNEDRSSGGSPFDKSGANTFANRFIYFSPADVGNMRGGAYPLGSRLDKGAVQHADLGGLLVHPGTSGGARG